MTTGLDFQRYLITGTDDELREFELLTFRWVNICDARGTEAKLTQFCTILDDDIEQVIEYAKKVGVCVQRRITDAEEKENNPSCPEDCWIVISEGTRGQKWESSNDNDSV